METERRILRSDDPSRAIRIFLAKNAGDPGLRAAVVSDDAGLLLGGVGDEDLDALAALGCAMGAGNDVSSQCAREGWTAQGLFSTRVRAGEESYTVTSLGAPLSSTHGVEALLDRLLATPLRPRWRTSCRSEGCAPRARASGS